MSIAIGVAACGISALFFGCQFVPIKSYNAGDGIFVQFIISVVIFAVGFCVHIYEGFPQFYPLAMLGGVFWTCGNSTAIPILRRLGMALGILVWNVINCLTGWAGARFGLFGMKPKPPASDILNYLGLACVIVGGVIFSQVKSNSPTDKKHQSEVEKVALNSPTSSKMEETEETAREEDEEVEKTPWGGRPLGFAMAAVAGFFYGITFVPVIYIQDNVPGAPQDGLVYVFSHYTGILLSASFIFLVYTIFHKSRPVLDGQLVLPAAAVGALWAIGQASFFVANQNLSQAVSFPIITQSPGIIASIWSIFYFKEITGKRNYILMSVAMLITLTGAVLVGLSKEIHL